MRKLLLVALTGLACMPLNAQNPQNNDANDDFGVIYPDQVRISRPLREIWAEEGFDVDAKTFKETFGTESEDKKHTRREPQTFVYNVDEHGDAYGNDENLIQKEDGTRPSNGYKVNWAGIGNGGMYPYDPTGAAGPNHYVQAVNATTYKIFNKTTGANMGSGQVGSLWSPATGNMGDPIVMYDRFADRWFISQFGSGNAIYIAISTTADPTGSYYTYSFTSPQFPDYLKFAIWRDGYYMTSNQAQKVFAFERSVMLTGGSARSIYKSFSPPQGGGFFVPMPGDADGTTLPTTGGCPIFSYEDNGWGGSFQDQINIYEMTVNWAATPTANIAAASGSPLNTMAFDASYNSSWNDISQPGTTQKLDGIGGIIQYRAQFRVWSGYNSVVINWPVKISSTQRSIMWAELRQNQSTGAWSIYQQGIYTPDATYSRWVGSIAMDDQGNIALCYAKSGSSTIYPSLCYTGRLSTDALGTMSFAETTVQAGTGSQTGGINRFGDYAQTTLDPDGITFWHTGMYMGGSTGSNAGRTRIYSFVLSSTPMAGCTIASNDADNTICTATSITFTATPTNGGTSPSYQWKVNGGNVGTNSTTYTTSSLNNGDVVTCVMTSNLGGVGNNPATSNALTITVTAPTAPTVGISTNNTIICAGTNAIFTATPTNGGTSPAYQWKVNGGNVGSNSATYSSSTLANGDQVTCTLTSNATCITTTTANSNTITMTVNAIPPTPTITPSGNVLTSSATSGNQWYLNGNPISGQTGQTITMTQAGNYTVIVTVAGCSSSASAPFNSTVSVNENENPYFLSVYPNPTEGDFTISFNAIGDETYSLDVFNELGQIVISKKISQHSGAYVMPVDMDQFAAGIYTVRILSGESESVQKIVVNK